MKRKYSAVFLFLGLIIFCCLFMTGSYKEGLQDKANNPYAQPTISEQTDITPENSPPSSVEAVQNHLLPGVPTPEGIPRSAIPAGSEDLYILKSQIVPPVCPACPSSTACPRDKPCPPCPPCARCPESPFECVKVPNYSAIDEEELPKPILNNFSQFGT